MAKQKRTFEEAMTTLEQIVTAIEEGDVPLENMLAFIEILHAQPGFLAS